MSDDIKVNPTKGNGNMEVNSNRMLNLGNQKETVPMSVNSIDGTITKSVVTISICNFQFYFVYSAGSDKYNTEMRGDMFMLSPLFTDGTSRESCNYVSISGSNFTDGGVGFIIPNTAGLTDDDFEYLKSMLTILSKTGGYVSDDESTFTPRSYGNSEHAV